MKFFQKFFHVFCVTTLPMLGCLMCGVADAELRSTPMDAFRVPEGFKVELVYEVPLKEQGSWVAMANDQDGSLIVSDQYGGLYRVEFSDSELIVGDDSASQVTVTSIAAPVGMVQGIYASKDGLYVGVNGDDEQTNGVYRLQDMDGDGQFETSDFIIPIKGKSEHGPHAIIPGPDGRLYTCAGNACEIPQSVERSRVPHNWGNDHLLGRMPDARGFMAGNLGPGGFVLSFKPDGTDIELVAVGFRNEYDIAFNEQGDLFTYDADMEWDVGTPWYRPTRVNHVVSGVDFGWRNGTGKYPAYAADSFGSIVDVGYGSPTGISFAYGTKFPEPYRSSLMISDWSYGVIYAVQVEPNGASYTGSIKPFISAAPLAVTDLIVRPQDGCMYVSVGGRRTQSALYRVRYVGAQTDAKVTVQSTPVEAALRRELESFHRPSDAAAVQLAIKHLGSEDRAVRNAARIVLEHQPLENWKTKVLQITEPVSQITSGVALARSGDNDARLKAVQMLSKINWQQLTDESRLDLLRAYQILFVRADSLASTERQSVIDQLSDHFPSSSVNSSVNRELAAVLLYLNAPDAVAKSVDLLANSGSADDQIHYALCLREIEQGWSFELRQRYFQWFFDVASARGGNSFGGFIDNIRKAAIAKLDDETATKLGNLIQKKPQSIDPAQALQARTMVREWTVDEAVTATESDHQPNLQNGKKLFAVGQCYQCHRFAGQGGIQGPDLTGATGRFSIRDLITAIVEPNKEISDQYQATQFLTDDDRVITGRVANLSGDKLMISTNMLDPEGFTTLSRDEIVQTKPSPVSMMPAGLINTFTAEEISDLISYIRSGAGGNIAAKQ